MGWRLTRCCIFSFFLTKTELSHGSHVIFSNSCCWWCHMWLLLQWLFLITAAMTSSPTIIAVDISNNGAWWHHLRPLLLLSFLITAGNDISNARYYCVTSISNNTTIADVIHARYCSGHSNNVATWWCQQSSTTITHFGVSVISGK